MSNPSTTSESIAELSFEQALQQLEQIIRLLENNQLPLADTIAKYKLADELQQRCRQHLATAKIEIDKIIAVADDGTVATEKFEAE